MSTFKDPSSPDLANAAMADLGPLEALYCDGVPSMWLEIATSLYIGMLAIEPAIDKPEKMAEYAMALAFQIGKDFGGQQFYMPKGQSFHAEKIKDLIKIEYRGNNIRQLAIKYNMSTVRIRQIVGE